jgi:lysophosphatidate acyltransferase
MLPFKKGAFHLAVEAGVPILPVVFSTFDQVYDSHTKLFAPGKLTIKGMSKAATFTQVIH